MKKEYGEPVLFRNFMLNFLHRYINKYTIHLYSITPIIMIGIESECSGQFQTVPVGILLGNLG